MMRSERGTDFPAMASPAPHQLVPLGDLPAAARAAIAGIVILSISLQFLIQGPALWWDEAVYLGLSRGIIHGYYSLDADLLVESFRPPLFPALLSLLPSVEAMRAAAFLLSAASIFAIFRLSLLFGRSVAFLSALFTSTSYLFTFFFTKILTESLFIIFLCCSLYSFLQWQRSGKRHLLLVSAALTGLAFQTRYLATALLLAEVIVLLLSVMRGRVGKSDVLLFLAVFLLAISPWLALNVLLYGNPVAGYLVNAGVYAASTTQGPLETVAGLVSVWGFFAALLPVFFVFRWKMVFSNTLTVLFGVTLLLYLVVPHKEPRYLLSFLPAATIPAAAGAERLLVSCPPMKKAVLLAALVTLAGVTAVAGLLAAAEDMQSSAIVQASLFLRNNTSPTDEILTQSYPFVYTLSERRGVPYCSLDDQSAFDACQYQLLSGSLPFERLQSTITLRRIRYVLSYAYEPSNPPAARSFFEGNFNKIASFPQWGNPEAVVIYRIPEP